jgi:hypothetical protein
VRENRTHGSRWRREETRPVGLTQPHGPGASRRPYKGKPDASLDQLIRILLRSSHGRGGSPLPRTESSIRGLRQTRPGSLWGIIWQPVGFLLARFLLALDITRSSDFCWAIGLRPCVLRPTEPRTQQTSWVDTLRLRRDRVATTPPGPTGIGHRRCGPARPPRGTPYGASLSFATAAHLWPLSAPPSRKPPTHTAVRVPPGRFRAASLPLNVGFPLSGLQDRTYTSDLNVRAQHT